MTNYPLARISRRAASDFSCTGFPRRAVRAAFQSSRNPNGLGGIVSLLLFSPLPVSRGGCQKRCRPGRNFISVPRVSSFSLSHNRFSPLMTAKNIAFLARSTWSAFFFYLFPSSVALFISSAMCKRIYLLRWIKFEAFRSNGRKCRGGLRS